MHAGLRGLRAALAAGLLLATLAAAARGDAFEDCIETLPPVEAEDEYDFEYDHELEKEDEPPELTLADLCPGIHATIAASRLAPFLPEDWADRVTSGKLRQWHDLLEPAAAAAGARPDPSAVPAILEGIQTAQQVQERTLWQQFKDWVKRILDRQVQSSESTWLEDWLREHWPSERVLFWISTGLVILLVAALIWIVYVELRAAGVFGRRGARDAARGAAGTAAPERRLPTLANASDEELPGVLVALLLVQLRRLGWLQDRQSMTHRELARAARFEARADGATFDALVAAAERLRYAATAPAAETLRGIVAAARRLLENMSRLTRSAM